ncbi:MAG: RhuM family protein [Desulfurella sp.]
MKEKEIKRGEVIIYKSKDGPKLDVHVEKDTVWLNLNQIAKLFDTHKSGISRHIKNVYKNKELEPDSTVAKIATVQIEGDREIEREIEYYNLDMIISVGYRVNSKRATEFRIWATKTLKEHLVKGYTINEKRLLQASDNLLELQKTVTFLQEKSKCKLLARQEQEILNLLAHYASSLTLYLIIKDHPFVDGNKRIASFLFVYFLNRNNALYRTSGERKINDNTLTTLALLVAISKPEEKDTFIKLITNLLYL